MNRFVDLKKFSLAALAMLIFTTFALPGQSYGSNKTSSSSIKDTDHPGLLTTSNHNRIGFDKACELALTQVEGIVVEISLERDNRLLIYEVEVVTPEKKQKEVSINALSGDIISIEND